jgi:hypothetical protein
MKIHLPEILLLFNPIGRRNDYYNRIFNQYNDIATYLSLYKKCTSDSWLKTEVEIGFSRSLKFDCTIDDVKKKLQKPNYHMRNNKDFKIDILLYRTLIGNYKVKCQLHFFENKLFFFNYTFPYLNKSANNEIISLLQKKYISESVNYLGQNIIDNFNSCMQISNNVELTINYVSLNCDFFNTIKLLSQVAEEQRIRKVSALGRDIFAQL